MKFNDFATESRLIARRYNASRKQRKSKRLTQPLDNLSLLRPHHRAALRAGLLTVAFAFAAAAQSPQLTIQASAGPGTTLTSTATLPITVNASSSVTLSYLVADSRGAAFSSYCVLGAGSCQGSLFDSVSLGSKTLSLSGPYAIAASGVAFTTVNNGSCGTAVTCTFTLAAGTYTLQANLSDTFQGISGGMARPFTETVTAVLTVNSGSVTPAPTPAPFPDPATCPIKAGIKSFVLEDQLFANSFQTSFIPTLSAAAFAAFFDPTKEVHTHFTFDTASMIFRADSIPLPLGAPPITPSTYDFAGNAIATVVVQIDKIYTVCSPRPTIMVTGPITGGTQVFGSLLGVPHGFSFSYDPSNTANLNNAANVTISDGGANVVSSLLASAIVTPANLTALIAGAPVIHTLYRQNVLDGSQSVTSDGSMTYQWSAPGVDVGILDPTSPQTRIAIQGPAGDYPVTLTVTTPLETTSTTVTVRFKPSK